MHHDLQYDPLNYVNPKHATLDEHLMHLLEQRKVEIGREREQFFSPLISSFNSNLIFNSKSFFT